MLRAGGAEFDDFADISAGGRRAARKGASFGRLLVTGRAIPAELLAPLRARGMTVSMLTSVLSEDELAQELRDAAAYLHGGEEYASARALRGASRLQVIAFLGVGYETFVDVAAAAELGIAVTNTPGAATDSVAAFTVGQLINANWRIRDHLDKRVPDWNTAAELPHELGALRAGIVGLGAIGTRIAEILRMAFGMKVAYFSRSRKPWAEASLGLTFLPLHELAEWSDALVVMVPGNDKTRHLVDASVFARMRPGTLLVNTARPALVDPTALHAALREGRVAAAVFDGFYDDATEAATRLLTDFHDRLLVTGHIASHTQEAMSRMVRQAVRSIENVLISGTDEYEVGGWPRVWRNSLP
nr:2-hydroxyacid dehydrogenase [Microbispora cellulosiformans]